MQELLIIFTCMIILFILNFPMWIGLIVGPLVSLVIFYPNVEPYMITQQLIAGVSTQVLLAVPMFIFAADIMSAGKTANRLLDFIDVFVGHIHGGMAITTAAACTFFGAISGSTQATVVAIGRPMYNRLKTEGYKDGDSLSLIISSAIIALLIPPSISMIMYCVVTGASVGDLFISGIIPGLIMLLFFSVYCYVKARKDNMPIRPRAKIKDIVDAFKNGLGPLGFPLIIFVGIFTGIFSPTEAAAIAVLYATILEIFIYKSITLKDLNKIALSTAVVTTAVFILVAAGNILSWVISYAKLPQAIATLVLGQTPGAIRILITATIFFFIAGMFVDSIVAIVILTPIFYGPAMLAGIHPIHLGILVTLQAAVASISPPFGANIFTACAVFEKPYETVVRGLKPYMIMLIIISAMVIFIPQLSTIFVS